MKLSIVKGATSVIVPIFIRDSSSTTGGGLTGLTSGSSGLVCYRARADDGNAGGTAISLSAGTRGTWSSGGFVEKDSTNMPGVYELGLTNATLATGTRSVVVMLKGATNMAPLPIEIELTGWDNQSTTDGGLSKLTSLTFTVSNKIDANVYTWNGTAVSAPSTAGIPEVNVKNINNVSASSVTTVNANIGATQPINFTGTGASALVKSDMVDIAGAAVSASTAQIGVNVVNFGGSAGTFTSGIPSVNTTQVGGTAQTAKDLGAINVTNLNTLSSHDPGTTIGTSTLTQAQVTGGAYALNSSSFAFASALDLTTTQKASVATAALTTQMTESYAADGVAPTLAQATFLIQQSLHEFAIVGTTRTVKKLDGSTSAATFTLDSATAPTSTTRAS